MKTAAEVADGYMTTGMNKASLPAGRMFLSAMFAGAFIALGAVGSQIAGAVAGRLAGACVFPVGLVLVVSVGVELFTGNCLLFIPFLDKKITLAAMLRNWGIVWLGNLTGSVLVALAACFGHVYGPIESAAGSLAPVIDTAGAKCSISIGNGLLRGILCNVLVCLAVWLAMSATDAAGKIIGTCLPVMLFVLCGYEHSVANMYFIPAGMLLSGDTGLFPGFLMNLIIVTLGNILGGAVIAGGGIYLLFVRPRRK